MLDTKDYTHKQTNTHTHTHMSNGLSLNTTKTNRILYSHYTICNLVITRKI